MSTPFIPKLEKQPNGLYKIKGVPIFRTNEARDVNGRVHKFDANWMTQCVKTQQEDAKNGFLPRVIIDHNMDVPEDKPTKFAVGFLNGFTFDGQDTLSADFVDLDPDVAENLIQKNKLPGRSAEARPLRFDIPALALLGATIPAMKLPDLRFKSTEAMIKYKDEDMADAIKGPEVSEVSDREGHDSLGAKTVDKAAKIYSPEEEADYGKFSGLMDRWMDQSGEKFAKYCMDMVEKYSTSTPEKAEVVPAVAEDEKPTEDKMNAEAKIMNSAGAADTIKYTDEIATLRSENMQLRQFKERSEWTIKFQNARLPSNLVNIEKEVTDILALPEATRVSYFEKLVKFSAGPSTTRIPGAADPVMQTPAPDKKPKYNWPAAKK